MTFEVCNRADPRAPGLHVARPRFNSLNTSDRLRESSSVDSMGSKIRKGRRSIFREEGLYDKEEAADRKESDADHDRDNGRQFGDITGLTSETSTTSTPASPTTRSSGRNNSIDRQEDSDDSSSSKGKTGWLARLTSTKRPRVKSASGAPPANSVTGFSKVAMIALLIALIFPAVRYNNGQQIVDSGADARVITSAREPVLETRQTSPTDVCTRWSGQAAVLNGTFYYFGGRTKTEGSQTENQWNNDFLTLDLTKSWDVSSPAIKGLPQPSGPPAVSLGYLWNDYKRLFLYGGQYSDNPPADPEPMSLWQYDIAARSWTQFENPKTSAGNYSEPGGQNIQSASEGAGISVPELGVSWYFGGHLDMFTTPGWTANRTYLKSLLEFTHPGYGNTGVDSLHAAGAPDGGAYRNITLGGIQDQAGFTERADGALVYVPGWGPMGILLGLGGGVITEQETQDAFASMSTIDVYDIKTSAWYLQETHGEAPQVRVNPCAVVFSAPDASSFNIYMYGGQNLLPFGQQTQYQDMWILTIPSFTWIKVDLPGPDQPAGRSGHMCAPRDGQIVVWGGYVGEDIPCDQPGIYNFDASRLEWSSSFNAGDHPADEHPGNGVLAGSYGYQVPGIVQSVIGGSSEGGATVTNPAAGTPTAGPFATGQAPVFTITAPGQTATVINGSPGSTGGPINGSDGGEAPAGTNPGLVAAGVIAGILGAAALYLGFCAWLYRRQVDAYKRHMAVANSYGRDEDHLLGPESAIGGVGTAAAAGAAGARIGGGGGNRWSMREKLRLSRGAGGTLDPFDDDIGTGERFAWVGQQQHNHHQHHQSIALGEPKWMTGMDTSTDASPGSGISGLAGPNTNSKTSGTNTGPGSRAGSGVNVLPSGSSGTGSNVPSLPGPNAAALAAGGGMMMPRPSMERNPWGSGGGMWYDPGASALGAGGAGGGINRNKSTATRSTASGASSEDFHGFMDGREPSFFSVVMGPRRALRVVNGIEE